MPFVGMPFAPFQLQPETPKKSERVSRPSGSGTPRELESGKRLENVFRDLVETFSRLSRLFRDFFQTLTLKVRAKGLRLCLDFFGVSGEEDPRDAYKWRMGSQFPRSGASKDLAPRAV